MEEQIQQHPQDLVPGDVTGRARRLDEIRESVVYTQLIERRVTVIKEKIRGLLND